MHIVWSQGMYCNHVLLQQFIIWVGWGGGGGSLTVLHSHTLTHDCESFTKLIHLHMYSTALS